MIILSLPVLKNSKLIFVHTAALIHANFQLFSKNKTLKTPLLRWFKSQNGSVRITIRNRELCLLIGSIIANFLSKRLLCASYKKLAKSNKSKSDHLAVMPRPPHWFFNFLENDSLI